ncbi:MAG: SAF domain-containing protein [Ornithinimicrobium sp.]
MSPPSPPARRLQRPSWRDARLVVGVLLVLLSVLAGSWIVARSDDTIPVFAAAVPLLPGQEVKESDLVVTSVRLDDALTAYVDAAPGLAADSYALRSLRPGELVPLDALGTAREAKDKTVAVPIDPTSASILEGGSVVDVWVSRRDMQEAGVRYLDPELLLSGAVVAEVPTGSSGLSVGVGRTAVPIIVPSNEVGSVISSVDQEARITLVPAPDQRSES